MSVHFMSQSVDWATPAGVYERLTGSFAVDYDPCALTARRPRDRRVTFGLGGAALCNLLRS